MGKSLWRPRNLALSLIILAMGVVTFGEVDWLGEGPQCSCGDFAPKVHALMQIGGVM